MFFIHCIKKIEAKILSYGETCINKNAFKNQLVKIKPISINEVEINKIKVSDKNSYGNKGSLNIILDICIKLRRFSITICIKLPQLIGYTKYFNNYNRYVNL